jgi:hypothetical protein
MPTPQPEEKQNEFVSRCIPIVLEDGTAKDQKQAVAVCNSLWEKNVPSSTEGEEKDMSETKMIHGEEMEVMTSAVMPLGGATSFVELDAMMEAEEMASKVGSMSSQFHTMVGNIMDNPSVEDKAAAVAALANEFSNRMGQATKETETHDKELLRYKEIEGNDNLSTEDDFVGGCQVCGFGEPELVKELSSCPFCHNEPGGDASV